MHDDLRINFLNTDAILDGMSYRIERIFQSKNLLNGQSKAQRLKIENETSYRLLRLSKNVYVLCMYYSMNGYVFNVKSVYIIFSHVYAGQF